MAIRKRKVKARARTGLAGVPMAKGFSYVLNYFHTEVDRKDLISVMKNYVKANFSKENQKYILSNPDYKFYFLTHKCATAYYITSKVPLSDRGDEGKYQEYEAGLYKYMDQLIESGKVLYLEKQAQLKDSDKVVSLSPMQRLQRKISNTIMQDLLDLEDAWMDGEKVTIDLYQLFKKHGLPNSATAPVRETIEGWLLDYEDAYHKRCDQAVEGYSHLKRPELNRRIKSCQEMLLDLDRIKAAGKAARKVRIKQPRTADKQVAKLNYLKEHVNYRLNSIQPMSIPGNIRLFTFNVKSKMLTEYVCEEPKGFEISGSTIKNFSKDLSRTVCIRKPLEFIPEIMLGTPKQIDQQWKLLTTKTKVPNGRINKDTILLRVMNK